MRKVIFTIVRDPGYFLGIWLQYYSRFFDNLIIVDNNSTDGNIEKYEPFYAFELYKWNHVPYGDYDAHTSHVRSMQKMLLETYDVVAYSDVDEIIYATETDLSTYIDTMKEPYARCKGYEMIDMNESPYTIAKTVLSQRKFWFYNPMYSKTLITKTPLNYTIGQHMQTNADPPERDDLLLIHLHRMDFKECMRRMMEVKKNVDPSEYGWQNKLTNEIDMLNYYYRYPENFQIEYIPEKIRKEDLI